MLPSSWEFLQSYALQSKIQHMELLLPKLPECYVLVLVHHLIQNRFNMLILPRKIMKKL